ncbi:hypothetical protein FQN53_004607 [Emmonsiellopsis sp. PD_33]|nr:hypothetical protein FQN53_004607 [Emmonsiellopsis sp. PD_33]
MCERKKTIYTCGCYTLSQTKYCPDAPRNRRGAKTPCASFTIYEVGIDDLCGSLSQINASTGEPILVASVKGADAQWMGQWYLRGGNSSVPIPRDPSSTPEGETIFGASLMAIKKEATRILGESVDITSISIPEHFNETSYGSVSNVGMKNEQDFIQPWQGFGLEPNLCDIDDGPHYVIFVEYNREYLELSIGDVGDFTFNMVGSTRLKNLGAKVLESENHIPGGYQNEYQNAIQDFISKHFRKSDTNDYFQDLRAIMIGGEAPRKLFTNIRDAVEAALPEHKGKIRDTIDPHFVGAVGAA